MRRGAEQRTGWRRLKGTCLYALDISPIVHTEDVHHRHWLGISVNDEPWETRWDRGGVHMLLPLQSLRKVG